MLHYIRFGAVPAHALRGLGASVLIAATSCSHAATTASAPASTPPRVLVQQHRTVSAVTVAPSPAASRHPAQTASAPASAPPPPVTPTTFRPTARSTQAANRRASASPQILGVSVPPAVSGGSTFQARVTTSADVQRVDLSVMGTSIPMHRTAAGQFEISYPVPPLPGFFHRAYAINVVAHDASGATAARTVSVNFQ